jgi:hypothetical protein
MEMETTAASLKSQQQTPMLEKAKVSHPVELLHPAEFSAYTVSQSPFYSSLSWRYLLLYTNGANEMVSMHSWPEYRVCEQWRASLPMERKTRKLHRGHSSMAKLQLGGAPLSTNPVDFVYQAANVSRDAITHIE